MAYYGCNFVFDGIPSYEYGLMLYDIGGIVEDGIFSSSPTSIYEDRTSWRYSPLHYGVSRNTPLTFTITFGADPNSISQKQWLNRWEMEAIASWLTEHDEYKYLDIVQPDLDTIRYKCFITDLRYTTYGKFPWAFTATVTCDSPFAYIYPETTTFQITGSLVTTFHNRASCEFYYPEMDILVSSGSTLSIVNHSDNDRAFVFSSLTSFPLTIQVDNENQIITNNSSINLYDKFNYKFFRLVRGSNELEFTGSNVIINMTCEYPINVGG